MNRPHVVSVIGANQATQEAVKFAERVGALLAEREAIVVCGGRGGVMEAVCRGAQQAGGFTLGILPGSSTEAGNAFLSLALPTGLGEARNALVSQAGEVVIAIGGGYGTLSEIALALKAGRKVIAFKTWTVESTDGEPAYLHRVETPEEAVEMAMKFVKGS